MAFVTYRDNKVKRGEVLQGNLFPLTELIIMLEKAAFLSHLCLHIRCYKSVLRQAEEKENLHKLAGFS